MKNRQKLWLMSKKRNRKIDWVRDVEMERDSEIEREWSRFFNLIEDMKWKLKYIKNKYLQ